MGDPGHRTRRNMCWCPWSCSSARTCWTWSRGGGWRTVSSSLPRYSRNTSATSTQPTPKWLDLDSRAECNWRPSARSFTPSSPTTGSTWTSCDQDDQDFDKKILNQDCCLALSGQERNQELHCNNHHPFDVTTIVRHNQLGLIHLGPPSGSNLGPQPFSCLSTINTQGRPLNFMYNYEHTAKINAFVENFEIPE